ncbi:hypothetical protein [Pelotomaculum schinkii]|uniref:hypothetical protein n=1 Tax=Pelotomaculum schinkii TaxID=78350 RepID=UPI00167D07C5|nr:hypothetical protein [Pelotomaculum schinkii]
MAVAVTAGNGAAGKTYTLTIKRAALYNDSNQLVDYTDTIPAELQGVRVKPIAAGQKPGPRSYPPTTRPLKSA